jgi:uncharacterized protein YceK
MKKRVLLLGLVVLMVLTGCGTTEKETKTKEKDPDKLVLNIEDKKEDNIQEEQTDMQEQASSSFLRTTIFRYSISSFIFFTSLSVSCSPI